MRQKSSEQLGVEGSARRKKLLSRIGLVFLALLVVFSYTDFGKSFWRKLLFVSGFNSPADLDGSPLRVHVLDMGKADAILIECEGHAALLDAGVAYSGDTVVDYMRRQQIPSLEYAVMSHPDKDHIGGMAQVFSEVSVSQFVQADLPEDLLPDSGEYLAMERALSKHGISRKTVSPGDAFHLGGAEISVLGPLKTYEDSNNASLVLRLSYDGFTALFCGDIEKEAEADLVRSGADLAADLLKVAHHGSESSSTKRFLKAVSPDYAVISVGPDNNELPREKTLLRLEETGAKIYRTDLDGIVTFSWDGEVLSIKTEK